MSVLTSRAHTTPGAVESSTYVWRVIAYGRPAASSTPSPLRSPTYGVPDATPSDDIVNVPSPLEIPSVPSAQNRSVLPSPLKSPVCTKSDLAGAVTPVKPRSPCENHTAPPAK